MNDQLTISAIGRVNYEEDDNVGDGSEDAQDDEEGKLFHLFSNHKFDERERKKGIQSFTSFIN